MTTKEELASLVEEIETEWLVGEGRPPYPNELAEDLIQRGVGFLDAV